MGTVNNYYIKANRIFTPVRKYAWMFTVMVAIGGLWFPKLGLLVILIMAGLLVTSFFNGRYWCGNICPHGSLYDRVMLPISRNRKIPEFFKTKTFIASFFTLFIFLFSNRLMRAFAVWGEHHFLDKLGFVFVVTYLVVLVVGGSLALFISPRTWCQFCPMGTMQKGSYAVSKALNVAQKTEKKVTISNTSLCHSCGKCARVCPFQLKPYLEFSDQNQFDNINCIKCSTCIENCPAGILSLKTELEALKLKEETSIEGYEHRQKIVAEILDINELAPDVREYSFSLKSPKQIECKAGQFILVKIQDGPKQYRAYSIASFNENRNELRVIIKKVKNGYGTTKIFNDFKIGDRVDLEGPMGNELVIDRNAEKVLFIANGIGITPFIAMTKDVLMNFPNVREVKLLAGQRYEHELLYQDYFLQFVKKYEHFEYIPVVSRDESSHFKNGYVTHELKNIDLTDYKVYMCGSKKMIQDSFKILLEQGVKEEHIRYESEEKIGAIPAKAV